jgi:hypothetical protein
MSTVSARTVGVLILLSGMIQNKIDGVKLLLDQVSLHPLFCPNVTGIKNAADTSTRHYVSCSLRGVNVIDLVWIFLTTVFAVGF